MSLSSTTKGWVLVVCALGVLGGAWAVASAFPVYFRADDVTYLGWAHSHDLVDAFSPSRGQPAGLFRPMQCVTWWCLYRSFGLEPMPYQVLTGWLFGMSFVFLFGFVSAAFSTRAASLTLLSFVLVFYWLTYVAFWFSDLTYILQIFFMTLALYLLVMGMNGRTWLRAAGFGAFVLALMSKEPSAMIVPAVVTTYTWSKWGEFDTSAKKRNALLCVALVVVGAGWLLTNPGLRSRQGLDFAAGWGEALAFLWERWEFYAARLVLGTGVIALACAIYLGLRALTDERSPGFLSKRFFAMAAAVGASLLLRRIPSIAVVVMFVSFVPVITRRRTESVAAVWFALPFVGILTIAFLVRTYLLEASLGLAILMGVALDDMASTWRGRALRLLPRAAAVGGAVLLAGVLLAYTTPIIADVRSRLEALRVVSATRQNLHAVVQHLEDSCKDHRVTLIVIDPDDMGIEEDEDAPRAADLEKAHKWKTMGSGRLGRFLSIAGLGNIQVRNLASSAEVPAAEETLLLTMNNFEDAFARSLETTGDLVFEAEGAGEAARLYRVR